LSDLKKKNFRAQNKVVDAHGRIIRHYLDVPDVLKQLSREGYELGVASHRK